MRLSRIHGALLIVLSLSSTSLVAQVQSTTTSYQYDVNGNLTQITDPLNRITKQEFDRLNRLTRITDAKNGITQYSYDGSSRLVKVTDARNLATNYTIDGLGNLMVTGSPDTGSTTSTYDEAGNVKTRTDAKGQTATYSYDVLNRVTAVGYSDGGSETYVYDQGENSIGRLSQITDVSGTTHYSYDTHGRVTADVRTIGSQSYMTGYQYDPTGKLVSITYPSGRIVTYAYDSNSRINSVSTTKDGVTTQLVSQVQYQPFGGLQSLVFGNGQSYARTYDLDGRISAYSLNGEVQTLSYDAASRLTSVSDQAVPANNRTYDYDELNRLTSEQRATGSIGYSYDAVGNRTQKIVGGSVTNYGYATNSNRLTTLQGTPVPSDANGSITNNGTASFNYDARGRMVSANTAIGQVSYKINALGQRVQKVTPQGNTIYHYDTEGRLIAEGDQSTYTEYVYLDGMPVAILPSANGSSSVLYVHTDQLDTPRVLSDQTGTVVWRWDSDGFGLAAANEQPTGQTVVRMNVRFSGQYFDRESNLHYNYFRDYDPQTGRYIQSDPIGLTGGINTYGYVGANPIGGTDSRGLLVDTTGAYAGASAAATATGTSVGVVAVGVGAAGAVGVGIGLGFNAAWDHFAGKPFGISVYDWVHPQSDPALQKEIEKTANQREAHRVCDEPPPPNLNPCELARWNLTKMLRCKAARGNLSEKWFGGPDQAHQSHITNNIDPAIERYRNAVDKLCKPGCN